MRSRLAFDTRFEAARILVAAIPSMARWLAGEQ